MFFWLSGIIYSTFVRNDISFPFVPARYIVFIRGEGIMIIENSICFSSNEEKGWVEGEKSRRCKG